MVGWLIGCVLILFRRAHYLLKTCSAHTPEFKELKEECIFLNTAYIETRYPVHWPTEYSRETTVEAPDAAEKIARMVREGLGL
jgi:HEPN domain-containing protein